MKQNPGTRSRTRLVVSGHKRGARRPQVGSNTSGRVATEREHPFSVTERDACVVVRCLRQIGFSSSDVVVGVFFDPGMIRRGVIRREVEHQPQAAIAQPLADARQRGVAAEAGVDRVAGDGEPRARDVFLSQGGQRLLELVPLCDGRTPRESLGEGLITALLLTTDPVYRDYRLAKSLDRTAYGTTMVRPERVSAIVSSASR